MKDFTVSRYGPNGKDKWYMYIGFTDRRTDDHRIVNCFGSAMVWFDGSNECLFNYWFDHSADWQEISQMVLAPAEKNLLQTDQLCQVGSYIVNNIKDFISQGN